MKTAEERREYQREWHKKKRLSDPAFREQEKARKAKYRASKKGRDTERKYGKKYQKEHPELYRDSTFKQHHGVTRAEADRMIDAQGGVCAICGNPPCGTRTPAHRLHVDHDKVTGQIREMLCHRCNLSLGHAKHDPQRLRAMADYLEKHQQ